MRTRAVHCPSRAAFAKVVIAAAVTAAVTAVLSAGLVSLVTNEPASVDAGVRCVPVRFGLFGLAAPDIATTPKSIASDGMFDGPRSTSSAFRTAAA